MTAVGRRRRRTRFESYFRDIDRDVVPVIPSDRAGPAGIRRASTPALPDYSFRAHARYILELLDALHIAKTQLVAFSMGGGMVLSIADIAPQRVPSIVMLSAIGVEEKELLGNYYSNHLLHGLQLGGLWLLREGTPYFGFLDGVKPNVEYARNFYDSDQRPLRSILRGSRMYQGIS